MKEVTFSPDEIISAKGTTDLKFHIVTKGAVNIFLDTGFQEETCICKLSKDKIFGVYEFLS